MTDTQQMLEASPARLPLDPAELTAAIDASLNCVQACTSCADSDLIEPDVAALAELVALCQICADICDTTARVLSRPGHWDRLVVRPLLDACIRACTTCAEECDRHADHHVHCAICARVCRACITACEVVRDRAQR
jgi:hypothetical protein